MSFPYPDIDDLLLLKQCSQKDTKAQEQLYKRYFAFGMGICLRYCRSREEAQEVLNDAFFKIFTNGKQFTYNQSFKGWLRKIFVNAAIDYYRRHRKHYHHLDVDDGFEDQAEADVISQMAAEEIYALVQKLPDQFRLTFNMFEIEGYTHEEITRLLDFSSVGTSRSNLSRAKSKLRQLITEQNETLLPR